MDALGVDANFIFQDEMREHYECHATTEEMETLVKKYRQLDEHGKQLVLDFMNYTLEACKKTIVKTVIKFPQRAPAEKETDKLENNTIDFPNMTPLKVSEQPSAAGLGVYLGPESFTEYLVQDNELIRRTAFAVPVSGDSMEPKFHDGDIALVNFEPAEPGDIVVVTMDGLGYIKKLGDGVLLSLKIQADSHERGHSRERKSDRYFGPRVVLKSIFQSLIILLISNIVISMKPHFTLIAH